MSEINKGYIPPQENDKIQVENVENKEIQTEKFKSAIKKFLVEQLKNTPRERKNRYGFDFDISDPQMADMERILSNNFEITLFQTSPTSDPNKVNFNFYVGNTEFHIQGKAADRVYELMEE